MVVSSFPPFELDHKQHYHILLCLEKRFFPNIWVIFLRVNLHLYKSNSLHSTYFHANWRLSMHEIHAATNAWKITNLKCSFIAGEVPCWGVSLEDCFFFLKKKFLKYFHKHHNYNKNPKGKQKVYYHLIRKQEQKSNKRAYDKEKSPATQTRECH